MLAACSSDKLTIGAATVVEDKPPAALLVACPRSASFSLPSKTVGGIITRSNRISAALNKCGAQIDGVRKWATSETAKASEPTN